MGAGGVGTCRGQGLVNISYGTDPCLEQADRSLDDPSCQGAGGQAGDGKEGEEAQRVDQLSVLATRIQIRTWWARGRMTLVREEIHKWRLQENHERKLWRIYKALCAEKENLPLGSKAQSVWLDAIRGRRGGKS